MNSKNDELTVYLPGRHFPSVSVTGQGCDLMCDHCRGAHLKNMIAVGSESCTPSPNNEDASDEMLRIVDDVVALGGEGFLVSGGCDENGRVPVMRAAGMIRYAASKGLKANVHTGFISREDAASLVRAGVNVFSTDIHQDPAIIGNVLHLDVAPEAYGDMLDNIISAGGTVKPHITAGFGAANAALSAELIKSKGLKEVILLALVPTKGTITENVLISEDAVLGTLRTLIDAGLSVTLGCMRPRAHRELEIKCIEAGVRKIVSPSRNTVMWAEGKGFRIVEKRTCCSIIH